jgi:hypothetical protein
MTPPRRVDLAHQVPFRDPAHGRIARHLRDQIDIHGDHRRAQAQASARARRFTTGVPGSHDDHLIRLFHVTKPVTYSSVAR